MNLIEATNYYLEENESPTGNTSIISKLIKMFNIDLSKFTDPKTLGDFLFKNKSKLGNAMSTAEQLTGDTVSEGIGDKYNSFMDNVIEKLGNSGKEYVTMLVILLIALAANIHGLANAVVGGEYDTQSISALEQISQAIVDFEHEKMGAMGIDDESN